MGVSPRAPVIAAHLDPPGVRTDAVPRPPRRPIVCPSAAHSRSVVIVEVVSDFR